MFTKKSYQLALVAILALIFWAAYFLIVSLANVFQDYSFQHHFNPDIFVWKNIQALRISFLFTLLLYIRKFQSIKLQRWIFIIALLLLIIGLCMPFSFNLYPFISGMGRIVAGLTEPWMQLYLPPALRATIEGLVIGLTGIIDVLCTFLENKLSVHLSYYHYMGIVLLVGLIAFVLFSQFQKKIKKGKHHHTHSIHQEPKSGLTLLKEYPYVFVGFLLGGLNIALFDYTYLLAKEVLPQNNAQTYQYAIYLGSILGPIVIGWLADKKGILFMLIVATFFLVLNKFAQAFYFKISVVRWELYYMAAFFGSALSAGVSTLSLALMGERLCNQGIFRAFAITSIFFDIGNLVAGRVYEFFANSFFVTNIWMGVLDLCLIAILWKFYKKERNVSHDIPLSS